MTKQLKDAAQLALNALMGAVSDVRTHGAVDLDTFAEARDALRLALAAPQPTEPKPNYLDTPIDWDLNGVPYTRKQAILDHCGPLALSYVEHAISYYTKD